MCGELKRDDQKLKDALRTIKGDVTFSEYARPGRPTPVLKLWTDGDSLPANYALPEPPTYTLVERVWGWGTVQRENLPPAVGMYNTKIETYQDEHSVWRKNETERLVVPTEYFREGVAYFRATDKEILWLCGIGNGNDVSTFTMPANEQVSRWHSRMPIVTTSDHVDEWLKKASLEVPMPALEVIA